MPELELQNAGPARAGELLEDTWEGRQRPLRGRELGVELCVTVAFLAALGVLIALSPPDGWPHPATGLLVVAYALAARTEFPIGAGYFVPTQLFLIPMFAIAPAQLVPALVFAGLLIGTLAAAAIGRTRPDRVAFCGGDAIHALGPALVLVVFAGGRLAGAGAAVLLLAFAAQLLFDLLSSSLHDLVVFGVRPRLHLSVLSQVWALDAALVPFGLLTAEVAQSTPWLALTPLPFVMLLAVLAEDRSRRIAEAHDRLLALQHERRRLRAAVQRVGDAFASNLDLDALLEIVTRAAIEALEGEAGHATVLDQGRAIRKLVVLQAPERPAPHETVELAGRVGSEREPVALVTVSRGRPFSAEERQALDHLCEQASISAANAIRHERLQAGEAHLRHQAFRDPLTGLANRARFEQCLNETLAGSPADARGAAVLFVDLDGFKLVNDTLGHDAGDELLVAIASRLSGLLRDDDEAARVGGDEFAVLLRGLDGIEQAHAIAGRLVGELSKAVPVQGTEFAVRASIGLTAVAPGVGPEETLRRADLAMYAAKRDGGDRMAVFHSKMLARAATRAELAHDLGGAAERGEFELRFQPIVDLGDGSARMVEALVRWRHPARGLLLPSDFVGLAEETGSIDELGRFVLEEACRVAAGWPAGAAVPRVSVNVSAAQFCGPRFAQDVLAMLARCRLSPSRLVLEVTESVLVEPDPQTLANLSELSSAGIALALDDFGTGYSALSYLAQFPVDVLKLDRSFLCGLEERPAQVRLVAGIIGLGHSLGMKVVAEGIEHRRQLARLRELGVDLGQGYLLDAPMTSAGLAARLGSTEPSAAQPALRLIS